MRPIIITLLLIAANVVVCHGQDQAPPPAQIKNSTAPPPPAATIPIPWVPLSAKELIGTYFVGGSGTKYSLKLKDDGTFEQIEMPSFVAWEAQYLRGATPPVLYGYYGVQDDTLWLRYSYKVEDTVPDEHNADEPKPESNEQRPHTQRKPMNAGTRLVPVRWGNRLYLLTTRSPGTIQREVAFFCHKIYFGEIPLGPSPDKERPRFYLREGDENKTVSGLPAFPKEWQGYWLSKPLTGKVLKFTNGGDIIPNFDNPAFSDVAYAKATLNIGSADGVKGELLFSDSKGNIFFPLSIKEHSTELIDYDQREIDDLLGQELSTHPLPPSKP